MCMAQVESKKHTKACPFCAETIKRNAIICKHCGKDIPVDEVPQEIIIEDAWCWGASFIDNNKPKKTSWLNIAIICSAALLLFFLLAPLRYVLFKR